MGVGELDTFDLTLATAPLDLADGFGDVAHTAGHAGLAEGELAAVGVERENAREGQVMRLDERACFTGFAEAGLFEGEQDHDRVAVVEGREADVCGVDASRGEGGAGRDPHAGLAQVGGLGEGRVRDRLAGTE